MAGRFLRAAYQVLDIERKPLGVAAIVKEAVRRGILMSGGRTPVNTMRARLSDDIRSGGAHSIFQRVGRNRFGLREWRLTEYNARPFRKEIPDEVTVCVSSTIQSAIGSTVVGYEPMPKSLADHLSVPGHISFLQRADAETSTAFRQLISYTWLESADGRVLSYTRGKYSAAHPTLLLGRRSVGFGGHVLRQDAEGLFGRADAGVVQAAMREIGEELGGLLPSKLETVGVIWDDTSYDGQRHVGIVLRGLIADEVVDSATRSEFSINQVQLLPKHELWSSFHALEFWSQLLLREFGSESKPRQLSRVLPARRPRNVSTLVIAGEIASGKSSIAESLAKNHGYFVVSASDILRRILGVGPLEEEKRLAFQEVSLKFIETEGGPATLAASIASEVKSRPSGHVVVDGIRQVATLEALRELLPDVLVLFVDCPRDLALANYRRRVPGAGPKKFADVREHEVEADLPFFRFEADAILSNAGSLSQTEWVLTQWLRR